MAYQSWVDAVDALEARLALAEPLLVALASSIGVDPSGPVERLLLVGRIEDAVALVTGHKPPLPSTLRQVRLLGDMGVCVATETSRREADALIQLAICRERLRALRFLRPVRGDRLVFVRERKRFGVGEIIRVSSIDRLGQVWATGAGGFPALPQDLERLPD